MNDDLPDTILYPDKFKKSLGAGFDGVFNWKWTEGCFGDTKIKPMDFDGVVERYGNYLIFETKDIGKPISLGQLITLYNLRNAKSFSVFKIWGKEVPEKLIIIQPSGKEIEYSGLENIRQRISDWFKWANRKYF